MTVTRSRTALNHIEPRSSLISISSSAFSGCVALTESAIPDTVQIIHCGAVENCTGLTAIALSKALTSIEASAFMGCITLENVVFYDGVTNLEDNLFSGCTSSKENYIPDSAAYIANNAFPGVMGITFLCDLRSYATEYALDYQYHIIPTRISGEEIKSPLNTDNTYYRQHQKINELKVIHNGKGIRPSVPWHHIRKYRYTHGAVEPLTGEGYFLVMPYCNTVCMSIFLKELPRQYPDIIILLCCDGTAWHKSGGLELPENIVLFHIPPYTPEMNPIEQIGEEIRKRGFRNEVFATLEKVVDRLCDTICSLSP